MAIQQNLIIPSVYQWQINQSLRLLAPMQNNRGGFTPSKKMTQAISHPRHFSHVTKQLFVYLITVSFRDNSTLPACSL